MKKLLIIVLLFITHVINAQIKKTTPIIEGSPEGIPICPAGMCPSAIVSIESFNLHKPRTSCSSGFGLCIKMGLSFACFYCDGKTTVNNGKVNGWVKINGQSAELHLPTRLKYEKGFEKTDFTTFEIEDRTLAFTSESGQTKTVKGAVYPVSISGEDYVIKLNFY